jgi:isochorismate hydrolase
MNRTYVEILAACVKLYQKVNQYSFFDGMPAQKNIEPFQEALNEIEALMTLHADKRKEFPLVDIIQHYEMDKNERAIIYFMVGGLVSRAPVRFEAFKMLLSGGEQTALVLLNLKYFSPVSKLSQKKIWLFTPERQLLNFDL